MTFRLDVYGVAMMRVALAGVILLDLADRAFVARGAIDLLTVEQLTSWGLSNTRWHTLHTAEFAAWIYPLHAICAGFLLFGLCSQLACAALFLLTLSLQARNALVGYGADVLLLQLLMIGCFLPLGAAASLDALLWGAPRRLYASRTGTAALVVQLAMMYTFSACHKLIFFEDWWRDGTALEATLRLRYFASPSLADAILGFVPYLPLATRGVLLWEAGGWLLLLVPNELVRGIWCATNIYFHLILASALDVGIFSHVCIAATLAFFPWQLVFAEPPSGVSGAPQSRARNGFAFWRVLTNGLLISVMALSLVVNVREVPLLSRRVPTVVVPPELEAVADTLQLKQQWSMFAHVPRENVFHVVTGSMLQMRVELFPLEGSLRPERSTWTDADITYAHLHRRLGGHRWLKLFEAMQSEHGRRIDIIEAYLNHTCTIFPQVDMLDFTVVRQQSFQPARITSQRLFRQHACHHERQLHGDTTVKPESPRRTAAI
jgi:hypothetical protein